MRVAARVDFAELVDRDVDVNRRCIAPRVAEQLPDYFFRVLHELQTPCQEKNLLAGAKFVPLAKLHATPHSKPIE